MTKANGTSRHSDVPHARILLAEAAAHVAEADRLITEATDLLHRRKPAFVAPRTQKPLSAAQKTRARRMRKKGMSVLEIARRLNTNHGRISEACR
jgi:hypothetical protein